MTAGETAIKVWNTSSSSCGATLCAQAVGPWLCSLSWDRTFKLWSLEHCVQLQSHKVGAQCSRLSLCTLGGLLWRNRLRDDLDLGLAVRQALRLCTGWSGRLEVTEHWLAWKAWMGFGSLQLAVASDVNLHES